MTGVASLRTKPRSLPSLIGILYAEDFDETPNPPGDPAEPDPDPPPTPALTQSDLDHACMAAVAAARQEWGLEAEQLRNDLLAAIREQLASAREAAEQIALATAEAAVPAILAMLSGALPLFCEKHGPAEARAIVDRLLPTLRSEPRVVVRVHPDLAPELRRELADLLAEFRGTLTLLATGAERGDVRVEWENGSLSRDTRQILQAMQDALGQLGLQQPLEITPKRRMAHAE